MGCLELFVKKIFFVCLIAFACVAKAQTSLNIDSLMLVLNTVKEDINRINVLNEISVFYLGTGEKTQAMKYALEARKKALGVNYERGMADAYCNIGLVYTGGSEYELAVSNFSRSLKIRETIGDEKGIGNIYNHMGNLYEAVGDFTSAMEFHNKALKTRLAIKDKRGTSGSYNNIGNVYRHLGELNLALNNYLISLKMKEEIELEFPGDYKNRRGIGNSYNNIGLIYTKLKEFNKALDYLKKGLEVRIEVIDKQGIAISYMNIGAVYYAIKNYKKTLEYFFKSLGAMEEMGNKHDIAMVYDNIGSVYRTMGLIENALKNHEKSLLIEEEIGNKEGAALAQLNIAKAYFLEHKIQKAEEYLLKANSWFSKSKIKEYQKEVFELFADLYESKNDFRSACVYDSLYNNIKDSILNEESQKQIAEMGIRYDSEKKDKELLKKDVEINKQQAETENRRFQRNAFLVGFSLVLLLLLYVYKNYREKKKANNELEEKNSFIEEQKKIVEDKNEKITDSINYAQRIQQAILPSMESVKELFPESFVLFKPKDVVSGDFYWVHEISTHEFLIAAVDCTGHGVPGALMSIMGYNLLEQIVKGQKINEPAKILDSLSELIITSLKQTGELNGVKDGMDIALCKINCLSNELEFAGAHNPLYIVNGEVVTEIKADRKSVGITFGKRKTGLFVNNKIELKKGDCIYLFSDGFVDQMGGESNKKFFYQPFKDLLKSIHFQDMDNQKANLLNSFNDWKGEGRQLDDVLVIGIRI